jgi:hypothetical protein
MLDHLAKKMDQNAQIIASNPDFQQLRGMIQNQYGQQY